MSGAVVVVLRDTDALVRSVETIGGRGLALSAVLGIVGTLAIGALWLTLLRGLGVEAGARDCLSLFFVTQLGKYVPGAVWPVVAQMAAGRRWGTTRRAMLAVNLLMLALLALTGGLLALATLPWSLGAPGVSPWWALAAVPVALVTLRPRVVSAVTGRAVRLLGQDVEVGLDARTTLLATAWATAAWACLGSHLWVLLRQVDPGTGAPTLAVAAGGMALAWTVGLVLVLAPAGAGPREAVLIGVCTPLVGASSAVAVALASRTLLVLADALLAGTGALVRARGGPGVPGGPGSASGEQH